MKNLNISSYGVEEMTQQEMRETEGGFWVFLLGIVVGVIVAELLDRDAPKDFQEGREAAKQKKEEEE